MNSRAVDRAAATARGSFIHQAEARSNADHSAAYNARSKASSSSAGPVRVEWKAARRSSTWRRLGNGGASVMLPHLEEDHVVLSLGEDARARHLFSWQAGGERAHLLRRAIDEPPV